MWRHVAYGGEIMRMKISGVAKMASKWQISTASKAKSAKKMAA
jgi:hypothetical protein